MAYPVLGRTDDALDTEETTAFLAKRIGDGLVSTTDEHGTYTVTVTADAWVDTVALCRDADLLAYDMFDCLFGVDAGDEGLDVVVVLYSTSRGRRILLRVRVPGGREQPVLPTVTHLFPGANWMEREAWDMFGIEFEGHPNLAPRLLTVENFEGWPLRKDFHLASRAAKPWPGVKEPAETDEEGNVIVRVPGPGEAPGPSGLDEVMARQSKLANPERREAVAEAAAHTEEPPAREEVELDQETYDRLIAEGKSERIARSKAKAAFLKKQRAAGGETGSAGEAGTDTQPTADPTTDQLEDAEAGEIGPTEADEASVETRDAAETAAEKAEDVRRAQAEARAERAAEQAADGDEGDDGPVIPEGTPPAEDDDESAEDDGEEQR